MAMRVYECEGGSPEWHQLRAGVITSSMFKIARAKDGLPDEKQQRYIDLVLNGTPEKLAVAEAGYKQTPTADCVVRALRGERVGKPSTSALNYAFCLAFERVSGEPLQGDEFDTFAMRRGRELEPDARAAHEALGILVQRAGFCTNWEGAIGASTDGLIGQKGASEYKALVSPAGLRAILLDDDLSEFEDQLQGGLLVTERDWMHFGLYCPALEPMGQALTLRVVYRDEPYIAKLEKDLREFDLLVGELEKKLRAGGPRNLLHIEKALACI
jgi:hypothetical protein